ncbi:hypothetical protein KR044_000249 [Drosophila immigrans]|nr:hypothetical protein KR044_000249 [Drosophila immigrans]
MLQKRRELNKCIKCLDDLQKEVTKRKNYKRLTNYMEQLRELQTEVDKRQGPQDGRYPISESLKVPHPIKCSEYTIRFCDLGELLHAIKLILLKIINYIIDNCGRELLEDALNARVNAYVPYSKFKVGAAFRTNCGRVFTGCNIENVALTPGSCAERTALVKGISEGFKCYNAGAVVAYNASGFTTPCGVCRQFIVEFAKTDIPIYIGQAPELSSKLPAFNDEDEVLVTSIFHLLPHSFTVF